MAANIHPDFRSEMTPKDMIEQAVFGGKYMTDCTGEFLWKWFSNAGLCHELHAPYLNFLGYLIQKVLKDVQHYEIVVMPAIAATGGAVWFYRYRLKNYCNEVN